MAAVGCLCLAFTVSLAVGADAKKDDWKIRIIPLTKPRSPAPPPLPMQEPPSYEGTPKPSAKLPPLPAPETPATRQQPNIRPAHKSEVAAEVARYLAIYRSIPYSRNEFQLNPLYRRDLALALLFNQFPPPSNIMQSDMMQSGNPGQSLMPPFGGGPPIVPYGNGPNYGGPTLPWPGMYPPGWYQY